MIDLNCDMGELEDSAHEAALMQHITSANIACGGHAGDEATMERTVRLALARGVHIGAHPGYPDRANFGRLEISMSPAEIARTVHQQIERLDAVVRRLGGKIVHVKPHGAMYNVAVRNAEVARAIGEGVADGTPPFRFSGWPFRRCSKYGGRWASPRWGGASPTAATNPMAPSSSQIPRRADYRPAEARRAGLAVARGGIARTICVHGDTPGAVPFSRPAAKHWPALTDQTRQAEGGGRCETADHNRLDSAANRCEAGQPAFYVPENE